LSDGTRTSHYEFDLDPARIAQHPPEARGGSKLLVVDRAARSLLPRAFSDLADLIPAGDALVVNTTRVMRARLIGKRDNGAAAEIFLLRATGPLTYEAMVHPGGKLKPGKRVTIAPDLVVEIESTTERRTRIVKLISQMPVETAIETFGHVPLPPYIKREDAVADAERYQTVYAEQRGSVAAPTAGLHFTKELLAGLEKKGVRRGAVVLHVGAGTFKPVSSDDPGEHAMHEESFTLPEETARLLNETRSAGGKIWAVGTTTVRTLESCVRDDGLFAATSGETRIFVRPPYEFRAVDRLITNFHLPRSTLIMLVAAFAGYDLTMRAYADAIASDYRFFSYGDAMVVI
jgi:S-adenosylmethionine:tRNA ribosyltransferase-isomerase